MALSHQAGASDRDRLIENGYGELGFSLGGGTVLMFRLDHRISKDIDLFTHDAKAIGFLSPRLNGVAAAQAHTTRNRRTALSLCWR